MTKPKAVWVLWQWDGGEYIPTFSIKKLKASYSVKEFCSDAMLGAPKHVYRILPAGRKPRR